MSDVRVTVTGQKEVLKKLEKISQERAAAIVEAVEVTQAFIVNDAKLIVPVKTGFLQSSIQADKVEVNLRTAEVTGTVTADAEYASHVEFGTRFQKAQPYMVPAVLKNKAGFLRRMKAAMKG